jgi:putative two-component system response regulator
MTTTLEQPGQGFAGRPALLSNRKPRIVFVDDEPPILDLLRRMVRVPNYEWDIESFSDSKQAWDWLRKGRADVIVTDVMMPGMTGPELLRRLRENESTRDTPVIVLTALNERSLKRQVLDLGATDLLNKPVEANDLLARLRSALRLKQCQDELKIQNETLERKVVERTRQLQASRIEIIWRLACAAEIHDEETGCHVLRVGHICRIIAEALHQPREFVDMLFLAAPLHDLGKIGIPDAILHKPGRLTNEERAIMQTHCQIGERILSAGIPSLEFLHSNLRAVELTALAEQDPVLSMAREIAGAHHERWDGHGYPRSLAGEHIPLSARITAVADVYDALTSERDYKPAMPAIGALDLIRRDAGRQFDPAVCEAFSRAWDEIEELRSRLSQLRHSAIQASI